MHAPQERERTSGPEPRLRDSGSSFRVGLDAGVFDELRQAAVTLSVWRRQLPADIRRGLALSVRRVETAFDDVVAPDSYELDSVFRGWPSDAARQWLMRDVARLVRSFAARANSRRVRLRFGPIRDDRCRKFHVDYTRLRLITTYVGPATQWIADEDVQRSALADPPACPNEANRLILRAGGSVRQARAGDVLLMKGELSRSPGLVHRSPPVASTGCCRVVLVVTTVD